MYDAKGYAGDEGVIMHTISIPLATLPEKCAWGANHIRLFCGAFTATPNADIPDEWYQGTLCLCGHLLDDEHRQFGNILPC